MGWLAPTPDPADQLPEGARLLKDAGTLDQILDEDFVAKGKPYRELGEGELPELLGIASERHKALNWLAGLARDHNWADVPTET